MKIARFIIINYKIFPNYFEDIFIFSEQTSYVCDHGYTQLNSVQEEIGKQIKQFFSNGICPNLKIYLGCIFSLSVPMI